MVQNLEEDLMVTEKDAGQTTVRQIQIIERVFWLQEKHKFLNKS
jgi:hypothetical protein